MKQFVGVFMLYLHAIFHVSGCSGSL